MKKLFILLGAILLSFTLVSCKEEIKYEEYEKSQLLNENLLKKEYEVIKEYVSMNIDNIDETFEGKELYKTHFENNEQNYYICGYLDKSIVKVLEDVIYVNMSSNKKTIFGKGEYLLKWNIVVRNDVISIEDYPIYWYKIPKNSSVPEKISNKFLIIVLESANIVFENIKGNDAFKVEMLYESDKFYSNMYNTTYDRDEMLDSKCLLALTSSYKDAKMAGIILAEDYDLKIRSCGLRINYFDGIEYVTFGRHTIYHDKDLKEKLDYIEDENYRINFKLEDILKILGR